MRINSNKINVAILTLVILLLSFNQKIKADDVINEFVGKSIRFKSSLEGKRYLTVVGGRAERKTGLGVSYDSGGFAQIFKLEDAGNGYVYIKAERGGVHLGKLDNGTPVWMWSFSGGNAQKWKIELFKESKMTSFLPEEHGFKFTNSFKNGLIRNGPDVFEFGGLCGGMVYSALDYFYSGIKIPTTNRVPSKNSPLESYIYERQQNSFFPNGDKWLELTFNPFGARDREFYYWGLEGRLATLKKRIDNNQPVPLGLYTTGNGFKGHHQVLAIGYDLGGYRFLKENDPNRGMVKIFIYDPNHPEQVMILKPGLENSWSYFSTRKDGNRYIEKTEKKRWRTYFIDDSGFFISHFQKLFNNFQIYSNITATLPIPVFIAYERILTFINNCISAI